MSETLQIPSSVNGFAEDKEEARNLRQSKVLPALEKGEALVLDFSKVSYATQAYIHTLLSEALQRFGDQALEWIEFKNCSPSVRSVIELVVDYSLAGFAEQRTEG